MQLDREVPYAPEAEISVLGGMLMDPEAVPTALEMLTADDFYREANRLIFAGMERLFSAGKAIDPPLLLEHLNQRGELDRIGGAIYMAELLDAVPTAANLAYHAEVVRDRALLRRLVKAGQETVADALAESDAPAADRIDRAAHRVFALAMDNDAEGPRPIKLVLTPTFEDIERRQGVQGGITGVPSGYPDLDEMTGGFQKGDFVILAARPSMGKTSIVVGMALHAAISEREPVAIYSLEMGKEQIVQRMLCHEALVDLGRLLRGRLQPDDYARLATAANHLNTAPIWIDDRSILSITQLRASARRLKAQNPDLRFVVVDYLQLMQGGSDSENRNQEISQISRGLKMLAKELGVTMIALSQLSRAVEQRADKRPQLSDLRESGSLEQDADLVMFLYRPERYMTPAEAEKHGVVGKTELIIGKHRNGPTGIVDLYFRKESTRFESFTRREAA